MLKHFNFEKHFKLKTNAFDYNFFHILPPLNAKTKTMTFDNFLISKNEKFKKNYIIKKQKILIIIESYK